MSLISAQQLRERLVGAGLLIIDARLLEEYEAGHIPGARHLDTYDYLLERSGAARPGGRAGGAVPRHIRAAPRPAAFAVRPRPDVLATCDYVSASLNRPDVAVLDIRSEGEHTGAEKADCCPRARG